MVSQASTAVKPQGTTPSSKPIRLGKVISYMILVVGIVIAIMPFLWMISASLMTQAEVNRGTILPANPRPENYTDAWESADFGQYMWNSARIAVITIVGLLIICVPAAYAFARMNFWGKNVIFVGMLTTLMIPDIVTLIPNFLTVIWLNRFGQAVCGDVCAWYDNWPGLTIPFMASAFTIFLLRQFFAQIPTDLWDAAQIDGAGHLTFLLRVVVPLSRAPIMTVVTFSFIGSWNSLLWPLLVTSRNGSWQPVAAGLSHFVNTDSPNDFQLQMAASVIMIIPILLVYFVTQKQFTEGIATSGLKG
jgi:ABC-type glycerol-3-phosphate transport system permease component